MNKKFFYFLFYIYYYTEFAISEITEFQNVVDGFLQIADALAAEVEKEKLKVFFHYFIRTIVT